MLLFGLCQRTERALSKNGVPLPAIVRRKTAYSNDVSYDRGMNPYAKPDERRIGVHRPKISHLAKAIDPRTRKERQAEKQAIAKERRAIKKSARRHLQQQLLAELEEG